MKNIQVIDGADNCTFPIFQATAEEFALIFPNGTDLEFAEELAARLEKEGHAFPVALWERPIRKAEAMGIHGTLFYGFAAKRHHFPSSKREKDFNPAGLNPAQRRLYTE